MAQYRMSSQVIGRSSGRSSVAAAAYRAGVSMADERTGVIHDFSRRQGVLHSEIMAPDNAPDWMTDRAQLWNAVERVETRVNAQLAREIQFSLPHELTDDQRRELLRGFVAEHFVGRGMIADIAIHRPDREGDERNHHAHVMLTMRELTGEGFHRSKATATARSWNDKELYEGWRAAWADHQNRALEREGHAARVDHRSYEAQGIDREPTFHLGTAANEIERSGRQSRIGDQNRATEDRNNLRDRADQAATVIRLDIERLKRAQAKATHERLAALQSAQDLTALDLGRRQHGEAFTLKAQLAASYDAPRRDLAASAAAIDSRLQATGFRKLLRDVSGRSERDRQQGEAIRRTLGDIAARERAAIALQVRQHTAERDALRSAQAKQQEATRARIAAEFEAKRRAEVRARRDAQVAERDRQQKQAAANQNRDRFNRAPERRARPQAPPPPLEKPTMREFDKAADPKGWEIKTADHEKRFVRVSNPQPTPQGEVIQPRREERDVPKPAPAKAETPKKDAPASIRTAAPDGFKRPTPAPLPAKDWSAPSTSTSPAAPTPQKDWNAATEKAATVEPRKDWDAAREAHKPVVRQRDKDRDFDRDR